MTHKTTMLAAAVGIMLAAGTADAWRGGRWGGRGWGGPGGPGGWGPVPGDAMHCGGMLLHAPPDQLKAQLGLSDAQISRITAIRNNLLHKRIDLGAKLQRHQIELRQLMLKDLPPQNKVLQVMRRKRSIRGVMNEERIKAHLKGLAVLDAAQRKQLRAKCLAWGPGRRRGWGGPGWGGPGGPGWGGPGGPGWGGPGGPGWGGRGRGGGPGWGPGQGAPGWNPPPAPPAPPATP